MASFDAQAEIAALREEVSSLNKEIAARSAAAYGEVKGRAASAGRSIRSATRSGADYVRSEGTAVARTAREHPAAVSTLVMAAGLAGVAIGFLIGSSSEPPSRSRYWR